MSHVLYYLYLLRMRCAASVLGFYAPAVRCGSCHMVASSLGVWPCRLKYDWALILRVICHPVARLPVFSYFEMAHSSHLWGRFIPLRCDAFRHRSILLSGYVLLDPVFASFALVMVVPVNLCPLLFFAICDYSVITGGLIFRCRVLTFILLYHFCCGLTCSDCHTFGIILFSLCLSVHVCYLSGRARLFSVSRLMTDILYTSPSCFTMTFVIADCITVV